MQFTCGRMARNHGHLRPRAVSGHPYENKMAAKEAKRSRVRVGPDYTQLNALSF